MPKAWETREADEQVLCILDMRHNEGVRVRDIAGRLGLVAGNVFALISRIDRSHAPCACTKPENKDGGMPPKWWA